ncbi:MAG TPA: nitronate monooxygenase [Spirochaetota bacterium]|nr:nitronate monooxygenase [Spirochaetota bacterium]HPG52153.1 nitronate monooxygenase [Spirochaetota bacterium]HPN13847.1 nitronate monooxygenase [Spirochaetota bacterium]
MKTEITRLFGIKYPIVLSGMSWISTPELVAAVANAGGLGILATGILKPEETREYIQRARKLTKNPFGANVTLYFPGAEQNAKVLLEEKVPVVNYSLGKGDWICKAVHAYGGKVIATVTTMKHALAAQKDGADALLVTGHEAAGHGGDVTSLVLIPTLADGVKIPIIAAGGFADGRGLAAALALGADGIAMGTRFMNSKESPVHATQKAKSNEIDAFQTVYTNKVDGLYARVMKSKGSERLMKKRLNLITAAFLSRKIAGIVGMPWLKVAVGIMLMGPKKALQMARMANGFFAFQVGTMDGDNEKGVLPIGQVSGIIHDTPSVKQIIERVVSEAKVAQKKLAAKL